jgi:hypothetical protein
MLLKKAVITSKVQIEAIKELITMSIYTVITEKCEKIELFLPSRVKTICKEANTKDGCKKNPKRLEHWRIKRALYLHAPSMNTSTD